MTWKSELKYDPFGFLLACDNAAVVFYATNMMNQTLRDAKDHLWNLPEPSLLLGKQKCDGSWRYMGNRPGDAYGEKYELLETWKNLRVLVEKFGFDNRHDAVNKAVDHIFSYQTGEGDIRGILSNQYTPYYMGAMLEIIIKAGYVNDHRVHKGFDWLATMRQEDGGWIIPINMYKMSEYHSLCLGNPILPDKKLPFSHMATGMVLRAYAANPAFRNSKIGMHAGKLMKQRLLMKDAFSFRQAVSYWFKFQYPFWWTELLSVMDSLSKLGFAASDEDIQRGIHWFIDNQNPDGSWNASYGGKKSHADAWVTLAVCRVLQRFLG